MPAEEMDSRGVHTCLLFFDEEERDLAIAAYIRAGADAHEKNASLPDVRHLLSGAILQQVRDCYCQARAEGYSGVRLAPLWSPEMFDRTESVRAMVECEARLNLLNLEHAFSACCQYDARRLDGQSMLDLLNTHPAMLVSGHLLRNPYYLDPVQFLEQLRSRGAGSYGAGAAHA